MAIAVAKVSFLEQVSCKNAYRLSKVQLLVLIDSPIFTRDRAANLLRFKDGPFMQYGDQTRDSDRFGGNVYSIETLAKAARRGDEVGDDTGESDLAALQEHMENEGVQDLVGLTENGEFEWNSEMMTRAFHLIKNLRFFTCWGCTRGNARC